MTKRGMLLTHRPLILLPDDMAETRTRVYVFVYLFIHCRVDRTAALVLIPYLLWVTFATCLNISYWWLNFERYGFGTWDGVEDGCVEIPINNNKVVAGDAEVEPSHFTVCHNN